MNPLHIVPGNATSLSLLEVLGTGCHRVLVEHQQTHYIVSQTDVVRFVATKKDLLAATGHLTLQETGLGLGVSVVSVSEHCTAIDAFYRMLIHGVSACAVIGPGRTLRQEIAATHLRGVDEQAFADLALPVQVSISSP